MPDDLAAEIAAHVLSTDPHGGRSGHCAECYEPWKPCLVRRLADERDALLAVIDRAYAGLADELDADDPHNLRMGTRAVMEHLRRPPAPGDESA